MYISEVLVYTLTQTQTDTYIFTLYALTTTQCVTTYNDNSSVCVFASILCGSRLHIFVSSPGDKRREAYLQATEFLQSVEPGLYVRFDGTNSPSRGDPPNSFILRVVSDIVMLVIPQQLLALLEEALPFIEEMSTSHAASLINRSVREKKCICVL